MGSQQRDLGKERYWKKVIREAARSGMSVRAFCRERKLTESQFYSWRRELKLREREKVDGSREEREAAAGAAFALVSDDPCQMPAGIEVVLGDGRRVRISRGADEATLRTVLAAMEAARC